MTVAVFRQAGKAACAWERLNMLVKIFANTVHNLEGSFLEFHQTLLR